VEDDGEEHKPIDDRSHDFSQVIFFFGHGFASLRKQMSGMFDVEDSANA
jgi:hypothetical protein